MGREGGGSGAGASAAFGEFGYDRLFVLRLANSPVPGSDSASLSTQT